MRIDNIKAFKLFIELIICDDDIKSILKRECSFDVDYYEYRCDDCLCIKSCVDDCSNNRFVRVNKIKIINCDKHKDCIKCGHIEHIYNRHSSELEKICFSDFYIHERTAIYDLTCLMWLKDKQLFNLLKQKLTNILITLKDLKELIPTITQTHTKTIDFDNIDIFKNKEKIATLGFKLSSQFTDFITFFDTDNIKKHYSSEDIQFNWIVYLFYALCQNAFNDAITDNNGHMTMESIMHIETSITNTNNVLARSVEGIVKSLSFRR
jgi:hypothetical protein